MRTAKTPIRLGGRPGRSESSQGAEVILSVWSYGSSYKSEPCSKKVLNAVSLQCSRGKSSVARKTEVGPKLFKWYKLKKKCNPPDFKFYLCKLTNKFSPYGVMLNSLCFILLFNAVKTDTKLTLHHMGKYFII